MTARCLAQASPIPMSEVFEARGTQRHDAPRQGGGPRFFVRGRGGSQLQPKAEFRPREKPQ